MNEQYPGWEVNLRLASEIRIWISDIYCYGTIKDQDKTSYAVNWAGTKNVTWINKKNCYKADKIERYLYF